VRVAVLLLLSGAALAVAGCGAGKTSSPAELKLQREDLVAVVRALQSARASVDHEVAAAKRAWPLVVHGLPASIPQATQPPIALAAGSAARVALPTLLEEAQAASLTGPGAQLAGVFRTFARLSTRGWQLIDAALEQIEHGSPATARFARANVAFYIESVYDGHFDLAQIGKKLGDGYRKLGGPTAFGTALTPAEVDALADVYSEASDRLHPHTRVRLGS
jgi:hypothetical protein